MTVPLEKAELRKSRLALRDALPVEERTAKSLAIAALAKAHVRFCSGTVVSAFLPIRSEVDTQLLITVLEEGGARVCVPAILDQATIVFRELSKGAELVAGGFATMSPGADAAELEPQIMLMPLTAFDASGNRIGYGGGYFDRAIARLREKGRDPALIGIAFDCQEVASVPTEPHDIRLHAILTESGFRSFDQGPV